MTPEGLTLHSWRSLEGLRPSDLEVRLVPAAERRVSSLAEEGGDATWRAEVDWRLPEDLRPGDRVAVEVRARLAGRVRRTNTAEFTVP